MSRHPTVRRGAAAPALSLCLAAMAAPALAASAHAERAGGAPHEVAGAAPQDAEPVVDLPEVVVRVPRAEAAQDPSASASIVPADAFAGEAKGVAEMVATAPGVAVRDYGGLGQVATVSIRGSTADGVLVLLDGLPLNSAAGGGVDLSSIPRAWISRIEVIRGVEGARYGAGALGGVVNVVTRAPLPGTWSASAGGGSFDTFTAGGDGAARAGPWTVMAAAGADGTGGRFPYDYVDGTVPGAPPRPLVRENNAAWRGGALAKAARDLGPARLDLLAQLSGGRRELPGLPPPPGAEGGPVSTDSMDDLRALLAARLSAPGPWAATRLSAGTHLRLDALDVRLAPSVGAPTELTRQRGGEAGATLEAAHLHGPGLLRAGAELGGEWLEGTGFGAVRARARLAASASEELLLAAGRLRLEPAVRAEAVGPFAGVSAKVGGSLRAADALSLRAGAGTTFRAPSFSELYLTQGLLSPNPDLRPEHGVGGDGGLVLEGTAGYAAAGAYATLYRDLVIYRGLPAPGGGERLYPQNEGRSLVAGVEAEGATARWREAAGLSLSGAYTLLRSEILRGTEETLGKALPRRPRHRLYARASVAPGPVEAHAELQWVSAMWANPENTQPIPAAWIWGAGASVRLVRDPAVRVHLEVRNLADDRTLQDPYRYPLPGRMVMVTLRAGSSDTEGPP